MHVLSFFLYKCGNKVELELGLFCQTIFFFLSWKQKLAEKQLKINLLVSLKLSATSQYCLQMDFTQQSIQIYKDNPSSVLVTYTDSYKNPVTFTAFTR